MDNAELSKIDAKIQALNERKKAIKAREAAQKRKEETRQKIILGGLLMKKAKSNEKTQQWLLSTIETEVTREADKKTLASLVEQLKAANPSTANESTM
ncbi:MAG: hypothetical protein ACPGSM_16445 [Thiolinea sp.]